MTYYLVILSALFATTSGNIFNPFAPLAALRSFSPFSSFPSFGSSFSNFPFGQPYGSSYSSDDPFNSAYSMPSSPFQNTFPPSPTPQATSPFGTGFPFPSFPSFPPMPSFPSFNSLANSLKGSGFKVTSASSDGKDGNSGQITIQVEKIDDGKPGEQKRVIQSFRTSGPLVPSNQTKGKGPNRNDRQRGPNRPTNNQKGPQPNGTGNQQRRPSFGKPMRPATPAKVPTPLNDLSVNGTTSQQQSTIVSSSSKPIRQDRNNNQLIKNNGAATTVSSSKTSSSLTIPSTSQNIVNENRSSFNSENSKVTASANSQSSSGVTVKRVDSSGRVTTGFIQP